VSPDPIVPHQPFTFELTGELDEDLDEVFVDVDLDIHFLAILHKQLTTRVRISGSPKIPKGPIKVVVGPVVLDMGWVPVSITATGTIKLTDTQKQPVGCVNLTDVSFGGSLTEARQALQDASPFDSLTEVGDYTRSCGTSNDHVQNLNISVIDTPDLFSTTVSGTSDEAFTDMKLNSTTKISKGWFFSKTIALSTPITLSPGFPAGPFNLNIEVVGTPPAKWGLTNNGKLTVDDGNGEQMVCVEYESATAAAVVV
jgi:hypothetical protein